MKIAASTHSGGLDDTITPQFGRAKTFTFVEVSDGEIVNVEIIANPATELPSGAGIKAAQLVVDKGAKIVLTGNVGGKAMEALKRAGVKIFDAAGVTVRKAIEMLRKGELTEITVAKGWKWR